MAWEHTRGACSLEALPRGLLATRGWFLRPHLGQAEPSTPGSPRGDSEWSSDVQAALQGLWVAGHWAWRALEATFLVPDTQS